MGLFRKKTYTGVTENTKEHLVLDAGVFFKNYDVEKDTVETAIEDILVATLSTATKDTSTNAKYTIIKPKETIEDSDYIDNITWIGCQTGSKEPLIIQIFNALSQDGLSLKPQAKSEAVLAVNFAGNYDISNLDEPPFAIYYPVKTV